MTTNTPGIDSIFLAAVELPVEERPDYLEKACGNDAELRAHVERLLGAQSQVDTFLESPAPELGAAMDQPMIEQPGTEIGPYRLLETIGEGGMGLVFKADQVRPVRRRVAVKVIKAGMDSREVIARFETERQALALMDHINIARVLDAGTTESGRPYFVMELVEGVTITKFCDDHHLTAHQRLELFVPICQAIQHAHQKGIIHRDIKPSNVIVTLYDDRPVPKVIDFGVAKATGPMTDRRHFTTSGTLVGTLEYMSPEQAEMSDLGVDTRSDIYSLGVLLYELLTGTTPVGSRRINEATNAEILRIIRDEEPQLPSTRLRESRETLAMVSALRHAEPAKLTKTVQGELDWIVMKALEKDRNRRYESANNLAADVQRYLADEPVHACPPSAWYRFRKFARRNKNAIISGTTLSFTILLALVILVVSNARLRQQQAQTALEKRRAETQQTLAESRAEEIRQGLERLTDANMALDRGRRLSDQHRWDDSYAAYSRAIALRPDHVSAYCERGELLALLGLFDLAAADFSQEFRLRDSESATRSYRYALLCVALGDHDTYRQLRRRMHERFQGTTARETAMDLVRATVLVADANADFEPAIRSAKQALTSEQSSWYLMYLSGIAQYRGENYQSAVDELTASLSGGPPWPNRAMSYPVLAMAHHRLGHVEEARAAFEQATAVIERWRDERYRAKDSSTRDQQSIAYWPVAWWDWLECEVYCREAEALIKRTTPRDDQKLRILRARSLAGLGRGHAADLEYATALKLGPDDPIARVEAYRSAGHTAVSRDQWSQAADEFGRASHLSPDDAFLWRCCGLAHLGAGEIDEYRQVCRGMFDRFGENPDWQVAGNVVLTCVL